MMNDTRVAISAARRWAVRLGLLSMLGAFSVGTAMAGAPLTEAQIAKIREYFDAAKERRDAQDYAGAIQNLRLAINIKPEPWLYYALAKIYEESGDNELALFHYRLCLDSNPDKKTRAKALEAITRVEQTANTGWVVIDARPSGVQVIIDGKTAKPGPDGRIELSQGTHKITLAHPGYKSMTSIVEVARGALSPVKATLQRVSSVPDGREEVNPVPPPASAGIGTGTWILMGVGGAMIGAGVVTYLVGDGYHSDLETAQSQTLNSVMPMTRVEAQTLREDGTTLKTVGSLLGAGGLGVLATGIILAVTSDSEPSTNVRVVSGPAGAELGLGLSGSF